MLMKIKYVCNTSVKCVKLESAKSYHSNFISPTLLCEFLAGGEVTVAMETTTILLLYTYITPFI